MILDENMSIANLSLTPSGVYGSYSQGIARKWTWATRIGKETLIGKFYGTGDILSHLRPMQVGYEKK